MLTQVELDMMKIFMLLSLIGAVIADSSYEYLLITATSTTTSCSTVYKKSSPSIVETISITKTLPTESATYTGSTSTPQIVYITPSPSYVYVTSTVSYTSVEIVSTDKSITKTKQYTTTTTIHSTSVITTTQFNTSFTTVTSTVEVPTPSGFIPIVNSTGANNTYPSNAAAQPNSRVAASAVNPPALLKSLYEYQVNCTKIIQPIAIVEMISEKSTKTSTLAPATITLTMLTTTTISGTTSSTSKTKTTISVPHTITTSITGTLTTTSTVTSTRLYTVSATTSQYAACTQNNILNEFGYLILFADGYNLVNASNTYATTSTLDSGYDCCAACQQSPACEFSEFLAYEFDGSVYSGTCTLVMTDTVSNTTGTCPSGQPLAGTLNSQEGEAWYLVYSNGPCGSLGYAGPPL